MFLGFVLYDGIGSLCAKQKMGLLAKTFFLQFLAYFRLFWPNRLDIARCKTSVDLLLYGIRGEGCLIS